MSSRVLIVDNDSRNARQLMSVLATRYDVRTAGDAESAVAILRTWRPALIITALAIPVVDGV